MKTNQHHLIDKYGTDPNIDEALDMVRRRPIKVMGIMIWLRCRIDNNDWNCDLGKVNTGVIMD